MYQIYDLEVEILAEGLHFPEGPIYCDDNSIILVEIAKGTLTKVYMDGKKGLLLS